MDREEGRKRGERQRERRKKGEQCTNGVRRDERKGKQSKAKQSRGRQQPESMPMLMLMLMLCQLNQSDKYH